MGDLMLLFREIDIPATCDRVDGFLRHDLDRLLLMSGRSLTDLKSPTLSDMPGGGHSGNHVENTLIRGLDAETEVQAVHHALRSITDPAKSAIVRLYIVREPWRVAEDNLHTSRTQLSKWRRRGLLCFADSFDFWQRSLGCSPLIDLHIYQNAN